MWIIIGWRNHAVAAFQRSRGRIVAADSSAIHTRRLRKGTTRRFQEVIYVTERAGATGNEDILSVHSSVRAQAMLQAQDLVLGFARFLSGSFAGSRAVGVSRTPRETSLPKIGVCLETGSRSSTTISEQGATGTGPQLSKKTCVRSGVRRNDRGQLRVARLFVETRYTPICTIKRGWESQPAAERTRLERPPNDAAVLRAAKNSFFSQVATWPRWTRPTKFP